MKFNIFKISFIITGLFLAACSNQNKKLPILGEREPIQKIVDGKTVVDTIYKTIPDFNFMNQDSVMINNQSLQNSIYIADFFFTSCPSICPIMSKNMLDIYNKYKGNEEVKFLSHTIDPKHDTIPVLKKYASKLGVDGKQWSFVLGEKEAVYKIAKDGYMNYAATDDKAPGGFIHSGYFLLIDKEKRVRGAYDGTQEIQVKQLMEDMDLLLKEYKSKK